MTDLLKPISRKAINTINQGRALVIELRPGSTDTIFIRESGRRNGYAVPVIAVYRLGARLEADRIRQDRKDKRKAKKKL